MHSLPEISPLDHAITQVKRVAIDAEAAIALVVDQPRFLVCRVNPNTLDLQHPQVIAAPTIVSDMAFQVHPAFAYQRCIHRLC